MERLSQRGITFRYATVDDREAVWQFMEKYFFPEEPFLRSLGAARNKTLLDGVIRKVMYDSGVIHSTEKPETSILALDKDEKLVGIKMGYIRSRGDPEQPDPSFGWLLRHFTWMLPAQYSQFLALEGIMRHLDYDPFSVIKKRGGERVYVGDVLCTAPEARGLGLGKELVNRSLEIAQRDNCTHYLALLTSIYSQSIFHKLGFQETARMVYGEEKDKYGNLVVHDHREHTHVETVIKEIKG